MEQRPLRLGDIVDDYCPRERRITNHAIVALIGDVIRQTRCTTCEAEHVYKEAKVPKRRKKDETGALYEQVLAEVTPGTLVGADKEAPDEAPLEAAPPGVPAVDEESSPPADAEPAEPVETVAAEADSDAQAEPDGTADEGWFGHRRLIRASLPRPEGEPPPARPIPEFTMHQRQSRGGQPFRYGQQGGGNGNGGRNGFRHGRPGGQGQGSGNAQGQGGRPHRGGRGRHRGNNNKRSR